MVLKKEILVVDDNLLSREMLTGILSDKYTVVQAENGEEAIKILEQKKYDFALILLDLMMPVMDGYTFLEKIKRDKSLSLIPVIVLTQNDSEEEEVAALAHGATDYVPKPYRPQVIRHRVESIIKLRETAAIVNQYRYDSLTGLYSKEFFFKKVQEKFSENPDADYCIICSNIENFKLYNDTYGVPAGDCLLKEIADVFRKMVGENGVCGRFSADRFICLQETSRERVDRQNFASFSLDESSNMKKITMRWGIYDITDRSITVEQMCDRAMLAVNSIKGTYDKYFAVYDDVLRGKLLREKAITDAMETALADNQFSVYLQPKYSLTDKSIVGAEALVRWNHPEWGIVPPGDFIPLFEKNGFISTLDRYVWEKVCSMLSDWKVKGYSLLPVSVNVSRIDIYRSRIQDVLTELLKKYGVEARYLHLEITESAYAESQEQIISTVNELRNSGFVIEMDDFGSGYSSLSMLSRMRLDVLKLDMKFIRNETAKPIESSILNDVINMAHRMRLGVVAEGVETREQMRRLQMVGCDYVQGYFFAKPMSAVEFEELLAEQSRTAAIVSDKSTKNEPDLYRVLIADEDKSFREKVCRNFEGIYNVLEAVDAQSAIECIKSFGSDGVAAVILSMSLPQDGASTVMKFLRREPDYWGIPVLATIPNSSKAKAMPLATETDDFLCKLHPVFDLRKRIQRLIDVSVSYKRVNLLQDEACRDYMTGILNRRGLQAAMESLKSEVEPLALCMLDLDNLKKVNDTYGHDIGDKMILAFTDLLRRCTRKSDVLCRYGGDEFIVILKNVKTGQDAINKVKEICRLCRECFNDEKFSASCSGGIAMCEKGEKASERLIERADQALYCAKREDKGGCRLWTEE